MQNLFEIISEDPELLVINKPAGLVCHPTKGDEYSSLISRARLHLGPGRHPQLINRLDRETSGVTLVAKTDQAARELRRVWERREVQKEYLAIVVGHPREPGGTITAPLGKDERSRIAIKDCVRPDGAEAVTEFHVQATFDRVLEEPADATATGFTPVLRPFSLLRLIPRTGRKHQIRIHLAHIGHPVVGDKLYGGDEDLYLALVENRLTAEQRQRLIFTNHALHAGTVRLRWRGRQLLFEARPEPWFSSFVAGTARLL